MTAAVLATCNLSIAQAGVLVALGAMSALTVVAILWGRGKP